MVELIHGATQCTELYVQISFKIQLNDKIHDFGMVRKRNEERVNLREKERHGASEQFNVIFKLKCTRIDESKTIVHTHKRRSHAKIHSSVQT